MVSQELLVTLELRPYLERFFQRLVEVEPAQVVHQPQLV
jgi:hypothetical protein